ncbi:MAG: AAA family ATPase [Thermodesulfobacteriota bacterium]
MADGKSRHRDTDLDRYWKSKVRVNKLAEEYAGRFHLDQLREKTKHLNPDIFPTICFSRKIGVGALELAEVTAEKLGYRVVDRQIIEHLSRATELNPASITSFDERYPGKLRELLGRILGDRAFDLNEYTRHLFITAFFFAHMEKTVFVGRGLHLMLPRQRVFAVRCIGSLDHRIANLAQTLEVSERKARMTLAQADMEQKEFFQKVHGKTGAPPQEFDLILNMDFVQDNKAAADAIIRLFKSRFEPARPAKKQCRTK